MKRIDYTKVVHLVAFTIFVALILCFTSIGCNAQSMPSSVTVISGYSKTVTDSVAKIIAKRLSKGKDILTPSQEKEYQSLTAWKKTHSREEFLMSSLRQALEQKAHEDAQPAAAKREVHIDGLVPHDREIKRSDQK